MSEVYLLQQPTMSLGRIHPGLRDAWMTPLRPVRLEKAMLDISVKRLADYYLPPMELRHVIRSKTDFEWFLEATEKQASFRGKFVAIHDGQIVAHSKTFKEALAKGREWLGGKMPLVTFVPDEEALEV